MKIEVFLNLIQNKFPKKKKKIEILKQHRQIQIFDFRIIDHSSKFSIKRRNKIIQIPKKKREKTITHLLTNFLPIRKRKKEPRKLKLGNAFTHPKIETKTLKTLKKKKKISI